MKSAKHLFFVLIACAAIVSAGDMPKTASHTEKAIAPGVVLETISEPEKPWEIRIVRIERTALKNYEFRISEANDSCSGLEDTLSAARRARDKGLRVVAAVNGDSYYYRDGKKLGEPRALTVVDGRLFSTGDIIGRATLMIDAGGNFSVGNAKLAGTISVNGGEYPLLAVNDTLIQGFEGVNGVFAYTGDWGKFATPAPGICLKLEQKKLRLPGDAVGTVQGEFPAGAVSGTPENVVLVGFGSADKINRLAPKTKVKFHLDVTPAPAKAPYQLILGAMGVIRKEGKVVPNADQARHPRSFFGIGPKYVVFGVVDGRRKDWSKGMTYPEMDELLQHYDVTDAVNLDGGGSSTLVVGDEILNKPSDGKPRRTGNALLLVRKTH